LRQRQELGKAIGQKQYHADLVNLGEQVAEAYRRGRTLEGRPIRGGDAPELAQAMERMDQAFVDHRAARAQDPVAHLLSLLQLQAEVVRAAEVLRTYDPRFGATQTKGETRASSQLQGAREQPIVVQASGPIGEPLARNLPGVGQERYVLLPDDLAALPTRPRRLAGEVARLLRGYHRAHLIGPGFGGELFEGIMLAPEQVNLKAQNDGVEHFIRTAAAGGREVSVKATAHGRRFELPLTDGGVEHVDVLTKVEYTITGAPGGTHTVVIEVTPPPNGRARIVSSTIPRDAPGGEYLQPGG
jgi:putative RNase toxin 4 of polymorphic toxin system